MAFYPPRIRPRMVLGIIGAFDPGGLTSLFAAKLRKAWRAARAAPVTRE